MNGQRPDPDALLARVHAETAWEHRGHLKIFLGAAPGVGKTYAMLKAAQAKRAEGVDVVAGYIEAHRRPETEAQLLGLEVLPPLVIEYRGATLRELDLEAALARAPGLLLVDELAHTNAPGLRHTKRWQDIEELLQAGINIYTTVNVQHLESLNDLVAQITGVVVRETVPDSVLDRADEVELIDIPPDNLLQRLREGKVYGGQQAEQAVHNFFRKGNLIALRELALRSTAERVDAQMDDYRRHNAITDPWPVTERILVCVSPSPTASRLVRATRRMAKRLRAEWVVAYVETPAYLKLPEKDRQRLTQTLRLAKQLGAEIATLTGENVSEAIVNYAHSRNASKIVIGKPLKRSWRDILWGSVVDDLVRRSGLIDIYVISGDFESPGAAPVRAVTPAQNQGEYLWSVGVVALVTVIAHVIGRQVELANLIMFYLLGIVAVAAKGNQGPAILASVLSVLAFDFFFVPPYLTFAVNDIQYVLTFGVMLVVALVISSLTVRTREQAVAARQRERRTATLYALSRELARTQDLTSIVQAVSRHISEVFESQVAVFLPDPQGKLGLSLAAPFAQDPKEQGVAQWVYDHRQLAGAGTDTLPGAKAVYFPLTAAQKNLGVLGLLPGLGQPALTNEKLQLLETLLNQTALAMERVILAEEAQQAGLQVETERLRNALLSSVSHDLRTPLTVISGATSSLLTENLDRATQQELTRTVAQEAQRLNQLVRNLLDMTRLESGAVVVYKEWQPLEEVIGSALHRLAEPLQGRPVTLDLPESLPLIPLDAVLIEQVMINLLENALNYTPVGSPLTVRAWAKDHTVTVEIGDQGPGIPALEREHIFEKFYRVQTIRGGSGLGLTICRGIIEAHGGKIWVEANTPKGASFRFTLPIEGPAPDFGAVK